jgi:hypothetical protein
MRRDLRGTWLQTAALARGQCRPLGLAALGLALSLVLLGGSPSMAQAARQPGQPPLLAMEQSSLTDPAIGRASTTPASGGGLVARSDTVTSSEPDYDSLNPVYISVTNPDHEHACADPSSADTKDTSGRVRAPDACGAWGTHADVDELP